MLLYYQPYFLACWHSRRCPPFKTTQMGIETLLLSTHAPLSPPQPDDVPSPHWLSHFESQTIEMHCSYYKDET